MEISKWEAYNRWINLQRNNDRNKTVNEVVSGILQNLQNNPSYQANSTVNGVTQPILATRNETRKCKITVIPGDKMCIGDLVHVFNEYWLCMELYMDEYGVTYGEIWMCNHVLRYQNRTPYIIEKHAIIDDGSYSKSSDKAVIVTDDKHTCYVSLDEESAGLYVDKRLGVDIVLNAEGLPILDVGKITWIDTKSNNYGEGSHLLTFRIDNDVYNPEKDNLEELVCDYIERDTQAEEDSSTGEASGYIYIEGRDSLRIGTGRTYTANAVDETGEHVDGALNIEWIIENLPDGISIVPDGEKCVVKIPLDDALIGCSFTLSCKDLTGKYKAGNKEVAVVTIG